MLVQHLRHPLERIDVRPGFWGLEWSCPSPWEVPEGIILYSLCLFVCLFVFLFLCKRLNAWICCSAVAGVWGDEVTRPMDEIRNLEYLSIDMSMWVIHLLWCVLKWQQNNYMLFGFLCRFACCFFPDDPKTLGYELVNLATDYLREHQHTPGAYPRPSQTPKWKEFLHKLLVLGLGYVPGICWKILRD